MLWRRTQEALGFSFTPKQKEIMNNISRPSVVDNCAGSGKTRMLFGLAGALSTHPMRPLIFYSTETNDMAKDAYDVLCKVIPPEKILLLATAEVDKNIVSYGEVFLDELTSEFVHKKIPLLDTIDHVLGCVHVEMKRAQSERNHEVATAAVALAVQLLGLRHHILFLEYYQQVKKFQEERIKDLDLVVTTGTTLSKLQSDTHAWYGYLKTDRPRIHLADELQFRGSFETTGELAHFDAFVVVGDKHQGPWQEQRRHRQTPGAGDPLSEHRDTREKPLLRYSNLSWAKEVTKKTGAVQYFRNSESLRWGRETVTCRNFYSPQKCRTLPATR